MHLHRNYRQVTYSDGRVETFDPFLRWHLQTMRPGLLAEFGFRGDCSVGFMWLYRVGIYSRYRTVFLELWRLTLYCHFGVREPHNPRTGVSYGA